MSYAIGLGEGRPLPAGIIALSGFIPTVENWRMRDDIPKGFPVGQSPPSDQGMPIRPRSLCPALGCSAT